MLTLLVTSARLALPQWQIAVHALVYTALPVLLLSRASHLLTLDDERVGKGGRILHGLGSWLVGVLLAGIFSLCSKSATSISIASVAAGTSLDSDHGAL